MCHRKRHRRNHCRIRSRNHHCRSYHRNHRRSKRDVHRSRRSWMNPLMESRDKSLDPPMKRGRWNILRTNRVTQNGHPEVGRQRRRNVHSQQRTQRWNRVTKCRCHRCSCMKNMPRSQWNAMTLDDKWRNILVGRSNKLPPMNMKRVGRACTI
jgi:hypothetical protein